MKVHLIKLAVGAEVLDDIRRFQQARLRSHGEIFHLTRQTPKRMDELLDGGSLFWVVKGWTVARQEILDHGLHTLEDGTQKCKLVLAHALVEVERRPQRPFQGWRYLEGERIPPDRRPGEEEPPPEMAEELRRLGLI